MSKSLFRVVNNYWIAIVFTIALAGLCSAPAQASEPYTWNLVACGEGSAHLVDIPTYSGLGLNRSNRFIAIFSGDTASDTGGTQLRIDPRGFAKPNFNHLEIDLDGSAAAMDLRLCFLREGVETSFERRLDTFRSTYEEHGFSRYSIYDQDFFPFSPSPKSTVLLRLTLTLSGVAERASSVFLGETRLIVDGNHFFDPDRVSVKKIDCSQAATCP